MASERSRDASWSHFRAQASSEAIVEPRPGNGPRGFQKAPGIVIYTVFAPGQPQTLQMTMVFAPGGPQTM
eukprot:6839072-Karenia_brevis.AAC.1